MRLLKLLRSGIALLRERGVAAVLEPQIATSIPEITPFAPRAGRGQGPRLNLLLPSINPEHYFGGAHTAVELYRSLLDGFPRSRIILFDSHPRPEALARFGDHTLVDCDQDPDNVPRQIVGFNQRYGHTIPVEAGDQWMATAWWTAYAAQRSCEWQKKQFSKDRDILYFIQDFEPGFYPWSSQSAVAASTYRPDRDFAVFNTSLLRDYFTREGFDFANQFVIEPTLNTSLRPAEHNGETRDRTILVYARPSVPRNLLPLICEGLRDWGWYDARCKHWQVLGIGELDRDLDLGPFVLHGLGKLSLAEYRARLQDSAIGVSLMQSPHPSYPPLEMAAFGMSTITNGYANKDLSRWFKNAISLPSTSPGAIARCLAAEVDRWEANGMRQCWPIQSQHAFLDGPKFTDAAMSIRQWTSSKWR